MTKITQPTPVRARLNTGETVDLVHDDCECVKMHDGIPHWLHMDKTIERMNRQRLNDSISNCNLMFHWFAEAEIRRLQEKERNMTNGRIEAILWPNAVDRHDQMDLAVELLRNLEQAYCAYNEHVNRRLNEVAP
jgi:hypothetical protein